MILAHLVEVLSGRRIAGLNSLDRNTSNLPPSLAPPLPVTIQAKRAILNASQMAKRSVRRARAASLGSVLNSQSNSSMNNSRLSEGGRSSDSDGSESDDEFDISLSTSYLDTNNSTLNDSTNKKKLTGKEKRELNKRKSLIKQKNKIEANMSREMERDQLKQGGRDFILKHGDSQIVCFKRMVTVFKFLRVVADAVETNHFGG